MSDRRFPLLGGGGFIPWSIAEEAHKNDRLGGQTLRRIAERGGYSANEVACFLQGHDLLHCSRARREVCLNKLLERLQAPDSTQIAAPLEGKEE